MLQELEKLKGFFRKKIGDNLQIRYTPEVRVHLDDTIEYSIKISKLLKENLSNKEDIDG